MSNFLTVVKRVSGRSLGAVLLVLSLSAQAYEGAPAAQVFLLKSSTHHCTATLLQKPNALGSCQLVTNAHCAKPAETVTLLPADTSRISRSVQKFFGKIAAPVVTKVVSHDESRDLAQLEFPAEFAGHCQQLQSSLWQSSLTEDHHQGYAALGFYRQKAVVTFSQNLDWELGQGTTKINRVDSGLLGLDYLFQLKNLRVVVGMSGGLLINQAKELVGINVRLIPFQLESYFIPLPAVTKFLCEKAASADGQQGNSNTTQEAGDNAGGNGGDNAGGNGGDNAGGNGGDNAGGNGGDPLPAAILNSPLAFLREPAEGIMLEGRRLLAFGTEQVDGRDDYRRLKDKGLKPLFQSDKDFQKLRGKLFERMKGRYATTRSFTTNGHANYLRREQNEWNSFAYANYTPYVIVEPLSANTAKITLLGGDVILRDIDPMAYNSLGKVPLPTLEFIARYSKDKSKITLTTENRTLECRNDFFLKLICSSTDPNASEEFSLSYTSSNKGVANVRYSKLVYAQEQKVHAIMYLYGGAEWWQHD